MQPFEIDCFSLNMNWRVIPIIAHIITSFIELFVHLCQNSVGHICVELFLDYCISLIYVSISLPIPEVLITIGIDKL